MNKKQKYAIYLAAATSTASLIISGVTCYNNIMNYGGLHMCDSSGPNIDNELIKQKAEEFTKATGIEFTADQYGYDEIHGSKVTDEGAISSYVYFTTDGNIDSINIDVANYKKSDKLTEDAKNLLKGSIDKTKNPTETIAKIEEIYKELTSEEYLKSKDYKENAGMGYFYKDEELDGCYISFGLANIHQPELGFSLSITMD